jgi:16S rRNA (guanine527-N7)-methyltransferase
LFEPDMSHPMEAENQSLLIEGAKVFGIGLDQKTVHAFSRYLDELVRWNRKINLTAVKTEKSIVLKHFLDSLSACPYLPASGQVLDIGSGAGFPGIPIKIARPSLQVTLIDSVQKKVAFQRHILRTLGLHGAEAVHGRAQDPAIQESLSCRFDASISRAFSDTETFLSLSHPFLRPGGLALAMKGVVTEDEVDHVRKMMKKHYEHRRTLSFMLPSTSFKRTILLFEKR